MGQTEQIEANNSKMKESREQYYHIFKDAPYAIVLGNSQFKVIECNSKTLSIFGYEKDEVIGRNFGDFPIFSPEDQITALNNFKSLIKGEILQPLEFNVYKKDRSQIWVEFDVSVVKYNGEIIYQLIIQDISERKKAEQRLKESEEKYRLITENANVLISVLNEKFEYEYINEVYQNILGYKFDDIKGKVNLGLIHPEDQKQTAIALSRILRKGKGFHQLRLKTKNGNFKWLEATAKNFYDSKERKKILINSRDISDRKVIEDSLEKSEQKFRNIVDSVPLGMHIYQVNSEGNLIFIGANTTADKILNVDNRQFIGKTIEDAFPPLKDTDIPGRYLEAALNGKSSTWNQVAYEDEKIKGAYEVHAFQTSPGNMVASFADITDRLKTERNLRESEEKFKALFKGGPIPTLTWQKTDEDFQLIDYNKAYQKYAQDNIRKDSDLSASFIFRDRPDILKDLHRCFYEKINITRELKYNFEFMQGERILSSKFAYIPPDLVIIHLDDITEKKHAEELILQENLKLMELNKMKEDLIIRVSHELKTPLTSIFGASQMLLNHHKKDLNKEVKNLVEISHRGGIRLKKLIENLIDTSKLKWEKLILNRKIEDLVAIVDDCVDEMMFLAQNRNIVINTDFNNQIFLKVDKLRLEQVITNILSNAIKNTPSQGKIYVSIIENKNSVGINIKDTGIGITLEEKKLLFEKFGKIERYGLDLGVDIEGAGLGLFISKEIVELHGGQITIKSEGRNKGTEVTIELLK